MTEIEAIKKHIEECKSRIENISSFMNSNFDANKEECCNNIEILEMAINALDKQIPKKPIDKIETTPDFDEDGDCIDVDTRIHLFCPICGYQVGIDDCIDTYCCCCGQRIDWSE